MRLLTLPHLQLLQLMSDTIAICRSYLQSAVMFNFEVKKYFTRGNIIQPSPSICSVCKLLDCEVSIGFGSVFRKKEVRPTLSYKVGVRLVAIFARIRFLVKVWWSPGDYNNWQLAASTGPLTYHHLQAGGHIANTLQNFVLWATFSDEILLTILSSFTSLGIDTNLEYWYAGGTE